MPYRPFYLDYVRHALRFYTRNQHIVRFKSEVDRANWFACHEAFKDCTNIERDILVTVYSGFDTLADNVFEAAKRFNVNQNTIWDKMKDFERKVAQERKLI